MMCPPVPPPAMRTRKDAKPVPFAKPSLASKRRRLAGHSEEDARRPEEKVHHALSPSLANTKARLPKQTGLIFPNTFNLPVSTTAVTAASTMEAARRHR